MVKSNNIENFLLYFAYFSEFIPLFIVILFRKSIINNEYRVFFLYIVYEAFNTLVGIIIKYYFQDPISYVYLLRIYNVVEFTLLLLFLYSCLNKNNKYNSYIKYLPILYLIFCLYDFIVSSKTVIGFRPVVVECIIMLLLIIYLFYDRIQNNFLTPLYQTRIFWIAVALLIYFAGNFFLFLYSSTIVVKNKEFIKEYTIVFSTIVILKNLFISISLLMKENSTSGISNLGNISELDIKQNKFS